MATKPIPLEQRRSTDSRSQHSSSPSASNALSASAPNALYTFRLLEALRSDDPGQVQPFLDELRSSQGPCDDGPETSKAGKLLGMAVRVASVPIIHLILSSPVFPSPNLPVQSGSSATALHIASGIGRTEVVQLLLNQPKINDTIRDEQGRTPLECASTPEAATAIEESRHALQLRYLSLLADYVASPLNSVDERLSVMQMLEEPRAEILNLNALDAKTGTSLLHEAARRRDLKLVEAAVSRGADVFVRDKAGKRVLEGEKNGDERIKVFLRQHQNQDILVQPKSDGRPPDMKGFLSKWVNYRSGWRTRWFVLENGVLSYYRNQEDEKVACRGSIALANASIHPSHEGARFEVASKTSASVPKIIVKSSHRADVAGWIHAIRMNIEYYSKHGEDSAKPAEAIERELPGTLSKRTTSFNSSLGERPASSPVAALPPTNTFLSPELQKSARTLSSLSARPSQIGDAGKAGGPDADHLVDDGAETLSVFEAAEKESLAEGEDQESFGIPHEGAFGLGLLNIKAQLELAAQLVEAIDTTSTAESATTAQQTSFRQADVKDALRSALSTLSAQISRQKIMSEDRERYLFGRIQREIEARKLWEENMLTIAEQQAEMDRQLTEAAKDNEKKRKALRQARGVLAELSGASLPTSPALEPSTAGSGPPGISEIIGTASAPVAGAPLSPVTSMAPRGSVANIQEVHDAVIAAGAESDSENEDDDEFFDAIEQNAIPNLRLYDSIAHPEDNRPGTPTQPLEHTGQAKEGASTGTIKDLLARKSLEPYLHVRHKLPIDDDQRPSVSLWGILKSSVGKDLTKISFPVSFNECTSMLQRMAEDMEYDACLTVAASEADSLKRIAFVAAFAMSNYSSTIGRIAKPFNPLLSQTFEYAIPNRYRYVSEQVSHHPPISACYCEAPSWKYYGEVDAQNKFQGRSFEIRPTGVAHAELIIPRKFVKDGLEYPEAGSEYGPDMVVEHYTWKKVTTNISNFIMGTPIIDHYGDLVVTNHRNGETCTLTFKPRGWRGGNAFEIKGIVQDRDGKTAFDIAGRWDSQLIAREANSSAPLEVDTVVKPSQKEYLLLWRNSEKPKAPFNLTPYAITLNDIPQGLRTYLCPTDCRLRTDQRAFENAQYEKAQLLKTANEEKQRNTRKLRAEGKLPPHQPRWFDPSRDEDSTERVWYPKRADNGEVLFWAEREKAGQQGEWVGVDHIFAEDA